MHNMHAARFDLVRAFGAVGELAACDLPVTTLGKGSYVLNVYAPQLNPAKREAHQLKSARSPLAWSSASRRG